MLRSLLITFGTLLLSSAAKQQHTLRGTNVDDLADAVIRKISSQDSSKFDVSVVNADELSKEPLRSLKTDWIKPSWWKRYRLKFGKQKLKKCLFLDYGQIPVNGTSCPAQSADYMCLFGEKECCDDKGQIQTHPETKCSCAKDKPTWVCRSADVVCHSCPAKDHSKPVTVNSTCPAAMPKPGVDKCSAGQKCAYGKIECCGNVMDETTCTCGDTGVFQCATIAIYCASPCPNASVPPNTGTSTNPPIDLPILSPIKPDPTCPVDAPAFGDSCNVNDQKCEYGNGACCCGSCMPDNHCYCNSGKWECAKLAVDCLPCESPPGGTIEPATDCPADPPLFGSACNLTTGVSVCEYGKGCCCETCFTTEHCFCDNGQFSCAKLAHDCLPGPCLTDLGCPAEADGRPKEGDKCSQDYACGSVEGCCNSGKTDAYTCTCGTDGRYQSCVSYSLPFGVMCSCAFPMDPVLDTPTVIDLAPNVTILADPMIEPSFNVTAVDPLCPTDEPAPGDKCQGDLSCTFGTESCCGVTHPNKRCICFGTAWACMYTEACMNPNCGGGQIPGLDPSDPLQPVSIVAEPFLAVDPLPSDSVDPAPNLTTIDPLCPTDEPAPGDKCQGDLSCTFGTETCCGVTHPKKRCSCWGTVWACMFTDDCMHVSCGGGQIPGLAPGDPLQPVSNMVDPQIAVNVTN